MFISLHLLFCLQRKKGVQQLVRLPQPVGSWAGCAAGPWAGVKRSKLHARSGSPGVLQLALWRL